MPASERMLLEMLYKTISFGLCHSWLCDLGHATPLLAFSFLICRVGMIIHMLL